MKLSQVLINKKRIVLLDFNEGIAYFWSYKYSGEGLIKYRKYKSRFMHDVTYRKLFMKYRIEP